MNITRSLPAGPDDGAVTVHRSFEPPLHIAAAPSAPAPQSDWQRYFTIISRHKGLVLFVTLLGTAIGLVATRFLDRQYVAKAMLWIEQPGERQDRDIISAEGVIAAEGWVQLVTSNAVLDSVVRSLRLYLTPRDPADAAVLADFRIGEAVEPGMYRVVVASNGQDLELDRDDGTVVQRGHVGDSIGLAQGFEWAPPADQLPAGRRINFSVHAPYEASLELAQSLKVRMDLGGSFLLLTLRGPDPARVTATANAIAARTVALAAEMKRLRFEELASILGEQYLHARGTLDTAENALRNFRVRTAGVLGARGIAALTTARAEAADYAGGSQPFVLRQGLDQLRRDRRAIDDVLRTSGTGLRVDALSVIPSVQQSPRLSLAIQEITRKQAELRELRVRYTDESAPVSQLRANLDSLEGAAVPALARQLSAELASRETVFTPRVDSAFGSLRRLPTLELDEARLSRDVSSAEELSTNVRQRYEAARLALISSLPDVRILDAAVTPRRPAVSLAPLLVVLACLTSLALAIFGVLVRDGVDPKVRYPEQVTRGMRLPIMGALPRVAVSGLPNGDDLAPAIEALRGLRLRVLHTQASNGPLLLTITSPAMGEGKSFLASNLALSFADAGYRTLLIDGDVRRGALHVMLDAPQRPGLTDVLAGKTAVEEAVRETSHTGLSFISSGTRMHRAPELLLSPRLKEAITALRGNYDVIIVDSPPLAAGVDPVILAAATRNLLMVLRSGTSDLSHAVAKMEVLDALPVRIIGAVLNDVRDGGAFRHYTYDASDYVQSVGGSATTGLDGPRILHGAKHEA